MKKILKIGLVSITLFFISVLLKEKVSDFTKVDTVYADVVGTGDAGATSGTGGSDGGSGGGATADGTGDGGSSDNCNE